MPEEGSEPSRPEMMLMYVAVTRAQKVLDRSGVAWIDLFIGEAVA
jgi:superfamily I DNA/RNA helicase